MLLIDALLLFFINQYPAGDERPCNRCIKRGLAEHCHDGVRKKAKYLHDAPNDALNPGMGGSYAVNGSQHTPGQMSTMPQSAGTDVQSIAHPGSYFSNQTPSSSYTGFGPTPTSAAVNSPSTQDSPIVQSYHAQQQANLMASGFQNGSNTGQNSMAGMDQTSPGTSKQTQPFGAPLFDPSDPSIFNFDISGFNFGNHYGAMEFGMLGHMSSGAVGTPDVDTNLMNPMAQGLSFDSGNSNTYTNSSTGFPYNSATFNEWPSNTSNSSQRQGSGQMFNNQMTGRDAGNGYDGNPDFPNAFAIAEGNGSISSASPGGLMDLGAGYSTSPVPSATNTFQPQQQNFNRSQNPLQRQQSKGFSTPHDNTNRKKRRDPSEVYYTVTAPYSYTTGFHCLTSFVSSRFNAQKTLRIAKALASIRPSFISCSNKLTNDDLIFMEKLFQRTLYEFEGHMHTVGTPTVVFRRTGEVASASKEFCLLSGWRKDVLLGLEPNFNINTGGTSGTSTGASTRGAATPRVADASAGQDQQRPQPVFLAELIDDNSVISFYEDFAKHAFGDARGTVSRRCKLLKYKTKEDANWGPNSTFTTIDATTEANARNGGNIKPLIMGEDGINALGVKDGKVDCMMSWTIKRDPFDVPMLIIFNVSDI